MAATSEDDAAGRAAGCVELPLVLLGLIAFTAFLAENGWQAWSALFLEREFGAEPWLGSLGPATVGVAVAVGRLGRQALTARISDALMLMGAAALSVGGAAAFALAPSAPAAMASLFVAAAGASVIAPSALSLAGRSAPPGRRGTAVATVSVIAYTGFFVGPAMLGFLSDAYGPRVALGAIAMVMLAVMPLWATYRLVAPGKATAAP